MTSAVYASDESGRLSVMHQQSRRRAEAEQQRSYDGLTKARAAVGIARIVMGVHLVSLHDSEGWRGRTGAKSFRRFLQEEGVEPRAAHQYMTVARAFVLEHGVAPESIAQVGMRVLVDAAQYLCHAHVESGVDSNVDDIVSLVNVLPAAEAHAALAERYSLERQESSAASGISKRVSRVLGEVDGFTHEERAELYQVLRASPPHHKEVESAIDIPATTEA